MTKQLKFSVLQDLTFECDIDYESYSGQVFKFTGMGKTKDEAFENAMIEVDKFDKIMTELAVNGSIARHEKKIKRRSNR